MHTVVWVLLDLYMLVSRFKKWVDMLVTIVVSVISSLSLSLVEACFQSFRSSNVLRIRVIGGSVLELIWVQTHLVSNNSCDTQQGQNPTPKTCNIYISMWIVCICVCCKNTHFLLFHYRVENHSAKDKNTTTMSQGKAKVYIDAIAV